MTSASRWNGELHELDELDGAPVTPTEVPHTEEHDLRLAVAWGSVVGVINLAVPLAFWWLDGATVYAFAIVLIAAVYIGFAVADGRPKILIVEISVATIFVALALVSVTETVWLLVIAYAGHGCKDFWQHRTHFVANTRWWPPFCATVDVIVAIGLIIEIAAGAQLR